MVWRQPFPGPGLAVRVVGEITREKLDILRKSDAIYLEELENAGLSENIWQSFAVLTGSKTVGVMGDGRTYAYCVALRAVTSDDAMTVEAAELPYPVLEEMRQPHHQAKSPASTASSTTSPASPRERSSGNSHFRLFSPEKCRFYGTFRGIAFSVATKWLQKRRLFVANGGFRRLPQRITPSSRLATSVCLLG